MATVVGARRESNGSIVLTVREEREVHIAAKDAAKKGADLRELAKAAHTEAKRSEAGRILAEAAEEAEAERKGGRG